MHATHSRKSGRAAESPPRFDTNMDHEYFTARTDEPRSSRDPRPRSPSLRHYSRQSSPRQEHSMTTVRSSKVNHGHDPWRQKESSSYSSFDRYSHSKPDTYDMHRRTDHHDRRSSRHQGSSGRRWLEQTETTNDYTSSSHVDRGWPSARQQTIFDRRDEKGKEAAHERDREMDRDRGVERDMDRNTYISSESRRRSHEGEREAGHHTWRGREDDSSHEYDRNRHREWTADSQNNPRGKTSYSSTDRTWRPAASWEASHHQHRDGNYPKPSGKKYTQNQNYRQWSHKGRRYPKKDEVNNWEDRHVRREEKPATVYERPDPASGRGAKRKDRTRSRSPSRSPLSRASSVGHDRKKRRYETSPTFDERYSSRSRSRSRSPSKSLAATPLSRAENVTHRPRSSSRQSRNSRGSNRDRERGRHAYRSSPSSYSRSRSRSHSRHGRSVHRLPVSHTVKAKELTLDSTTKYSASFTSHFRKDYINGHASSNAPRKIVYERPSNLFERQRSPSLEDVKMEVGPALHHENGHQAELDSSKHGSSFPHQSPLPSDSARPSSTLPRIVDVHVKASFPSVIKRSSVGSDSLKRFFPLDDEDSDSLAMPEPSISGSTSRRTTQIISKENSVERGLCVPSKPLTRHESLDDYPSESRRFSEPVSDVETIAPPRVHTENREFMKEELYQIVNQVGEGTFGKVYKAQDLLSRTYVALKLIRMEGERDGFPVTAMREIKLLQSLHHSNIINLHEMMVSKGHVYMVFEYMDHDLTGILSQSQFTFTGAHLKSLCRQMLAGLAYLHHKGVIHRDIKGSNILVNNKGELKLADFGLARFYHKRRRSDYTNRVITLWYRPPELLLGATVYGPEVDMWSAGCIMLELFTTKPVFQGNDEIHQLQVVYEILGYPEIVDWPELTELPWYELVKPKKALRGGLRELFKRWLSPAALDLAQSLLTYNPARRATAVQALSAPYFLSEEPPESMPDLFSLEGEWHEFESKKERERRKRRKVDV